MVFLLKKEHIQKMNYPDLEALAMTVALLISDRLREARKGCVLYICIEELCEVEQRYQWLTSEQREDVALLVERKCKKWFDRRRVVDPLESFYDHV